MRSHLPDARFQLLDLRVTQGSVTSFDSSSATWEGLPVLLFMLCRGKFWRLPFLGWYRSSLRRGLYYDSCDIPVRGTL